MLVCEAESQLKGSSVKMKANHLILFDRSVEDIPTNLYHQPMISTKEEIHTRNSFTEFHHSWRKELRRFSGYLIKTQFSTYVNKCTF